MNEQVSAANFNIYVTTSEAADAIARMIETGGLAERVARITEDGVPMVVYTTMFPIAAATVSDVLWAMENHIAQIVGGAFDGQYIVRIG